MPLLIEVSSVEGVELARRMVDICKAAVTMYRHRQLHQNIFEHSNLYLLAGLGCGSIHLEDRNLHLCGACATFSSG